MNMNKVKKTSGGCFITIVESISAHLAKVVEFAKIFYADYFHFLTSKKQCKDGSSSFTNHYRSGFKILLLGPVLLGRCIGRNIPATVGK